MTNTNFILRHTKLLLSIIMTDYLEALVNYSISQYGNLYILYVT